MEQTQPLGQLADPHPQHPLNLNDLQTQLNQTQTLITNQQTILTEQLTSIKR